MGVGSISRPARGLHDEFGPVPFRNAEHVAYHDDRSGWQEQPDEVAFATVGKGIHEVLGYVRYALAHRFHAARIECLDHQPPEPRVIRRVLEEHHVPQIVDGRAGARAASCSSVIRGSSI